MLSLEWLLCWQVLPGGTDGQGLLWRVLLAV
jgi:hypothetical protein